METKYTPKPIDTKGVQLPEELSALAEEIAKNVHEVWSQNRINDGWSYGAKRDDTEKNILVLLLTKNFPSPRRNTTVQQVRKQ